MDYDQSLSEFNGLDLDLDLDVTSEAKWLLDRLNSLKIIVK